MGVKITLRFSVTQNKNLFYQFHIYLRIFVSNRFVIYVLLPPVIVIKLLIGNQVLSCRESVVNKWNIYIIWDNHSLLSVIVLDCLHKRRHDWAGISCSRNACPRSRYLNTDWLLARLSNKVRFLNCDYQQRVFYFLQCLNRGSFTIQRYFDR